LNSVKLVERPIKTRDIEKSSFDLQHSRRLPEAVRPVTLLLNILWIFHTLSLDLFFSRVLHLKMNQDIAEQNIQMWKVKKLIKSLDSARG
jgi:hypothetical protein